MDADIIVTELSISRMRYRGSPPRLLKGQHHRTVLYGTTARTVRAWSALWEEKGLDSGPRRARVLPMETASVLRADYGVRETAGGAGNLPM